jgi:hypothetical protein
MDVMDAIFNYFTCGTENYCGYVHVRLYERPLFFEVGQDSWTYSNSLGFRFGT